MGDFGYAEQFDVGDLDQEDMKVSLRMRGTPDYFAPVSLVFILQIVANFSMIEGAPIWSLVVKILL